VLGRVPLGTAGGAAPLLTKGAAKARAEAAA
jgi:hypothetical protein